MGFFSNLFGGKKKNISKKNSKKIKKNVSKKSVKKKRIKKSVKKENKKNPLLKNILKKEMALDEKFSSIECKPTKSILKEEMKLDKKFSKGSNGMRNKDFVIFGKKFEFLKWIPEMSMNEDTIDSQHKQLFEQTNKLIMQISQGKDLESIHSIMHFLTEYLEKHFKYEENYMKKYRFKRLPTHKKIHSQFINDFEKLKEDFRKRYLAEKDVSGLSREFSYKFYNLLTNWWKTHMEKEDKKYAIFINKKKGIKEPVKKIIENKKEIGFDKSSSSISDIKKKIEKELSMGKINENEAGILKERAVIRKTIEGKKEKVKKIDSKQKTIFTNVPGFDDLIPNGIPRGNAILVAGGAGSGKTIFCLQTLFNGLKEGKKCFYMSFEESEEKLIKHMEDFGWNIKPYIKNGKLKIMRMNPFDITRNVDAMLAKQKGDLLIDINPIILPRNFKPDLIAIDSLTAIASAFTGKSDSYRIYIEQLFRFFEDLGSTSFLITETNQIPEIFSQTGVEEFLADGVVVLYNFKRGDVREKGIEVLKMRGTNHEKKIVAMQITEEGIVIYPEQEVLAEMN